LNGSSGRPIPGHHMLVLRAVFVPDGEAPPEEFASVWNPLRIAATYDPATGDLNCAPGNGFDRGFLAQWHPDPDSDSTDKEDWEFEAGEDQGADDFNGYGSEAAGLGGHGQIATSRIGSQAPARQSLFAEYAQKRVPPSSAPDRNQGDRAIAHGKTGTKGESPVAKPASGIKGASPDFNRFFDTLFQPLSDLAKELNVPEDYILGHAAYESGYLGNHDFPLNNPFGYTMAGGPNLSSPSIAAAVAAYRNDYGSQIKDAASARDFVERIEGRLNGNPIPGWRKYNSKTEKYESDVVRVIESVARHKADWLKQGKKSE